MSDSPPTKPSPDVQIDDGHVEDDLGAAPTLPSAREQARSGRGKGGDGGNGGDGSAGASGRRRRIPRPSGVSGVALFLVAVLLLAVVPVVWSTLEKTPRDKVGISYGGGPFEGAKFQKIVQPGSSLFVNGLFDNLYLYPADQRNYIVSTNKDEGDNPDTLAIQAPSQDQVQVGYQVAVYYKLNTDKLRQFHEQIGLKYQAYTRDGWNDLIADTFRQQIENSLQEQTRRFDVEEIFGNREVLLQLQAEVEDNLSERLRRALGDNYFCSPTYQPGGKCESPTFVVKRIDIPEGIVRAFIAERAERINVSRRLAEAEGIDALAAALERVGPDYVKIKAIESGKVTFWILPEGTSVTVPTGSGDAPSVPSSTTTEGGGDGGGG